MNSSTSTPASDFSSKHKNRCNPFGENGAVSNGSNTTSSNVRDQKPHSSGSGSWFDSRAQRRDNKVKEKSREKEWNRDRSPHSQVRENGFREDETRDRFRDDQANYPNYTYNSAAADTSFIDNNRRTLGMMNNLSTYNLIAAMNSSQWGMGQLDNMNINHNMNSGANMAIHQPMDMNSNAGAGMNPFAFMGMPTDPMFSMMGMGNFSQFGVMNSDANVLMPPPREIIHLSKSVLYPPNPNAPPPTTREKPPGCKTVFVGGLPENATDEILKEVFERCGEILTIRMSKKNFCHIRFAMESYVENAIYFSGYRIKIENKDDAPNTGRLHVDYAQARDDQYEYECRQRSLQREARHRERLEQEFYHPPTPPPVVHYSDHEATLLGEKLRGEETFQQAVFTLITWLERGECNKRNAGYFYSMIQSTNSHVRRLMNEKLKYEDELNKAKMMLKQQMQGILLQFTDIGKVFGAASLQKVWDHFTKAQRKNIELWKKQTEEIKNAHVEEVLNDRIEDEMEVSDDEDDPSKREDETSNTNESSVITELQEKNRQLQEETDSLRCQLEASTNETVLLKSEADQDRSLKELQLQALRQALQNMQKEMLVQQRRLRDEGDHRSSFNLKKKDIKGDKDAECSHKDDDYPDTSVDNDLPQNVLFSNSISSTLNNSFNEMEARLIGLISAFLNVHPFGASVDYICSYLHQIDNTTRARDVEALMNKFPTVFKEESTGIGASLEKKWTFCGFNSQA